MAAAAKYAVSVFMSDAFRKHVEPFLTFRQR